VIVSPLAARTAHRAHRTSPLNVVLARRYPDDHCYGERPPRSLIVTTAGSTASRLESVP
jgi:hypothetical protein